MVTIVKQWLIFVRALLSIFITSPFIANIYLPKYNFSQVTEQKFMFFVHCKYIVLSAVLFSFSVQVSKHS